MMLTPAQQEAQIAASTLTSTDRFVVYPAEGGGWTLWDHEWAETVPGPDGRETFHNKTDADAHLATALRNEQPNR